MYHNASLFHYGGSFISLSLPVRCRSGKLPGGRPPPPPVPPAAACAPHADGQGLLGRGMYVILIVQTNIGANFADRPLLLSNYFVREWQSSSPPPVAIHHLSPSRQSSSSTDHEIGTGKQMGPRTLTTTYLPSGPPLRSSPPLPPFGQQLAIYVIQIA